jgi:4-diphosphocytidyl-2-C-methyl-D-erythritol kinase
VDGAAARSSLTRDRQVNRLFLGLPAPAKLNLFLHIVGRRADGYHELQSVFVPVALADTLDFGLRADGSLHRSGDVIGALENDLALRAARLLKSVSGSGLGADIAVEKRIPAGSGMGGGSSDAATTLLALNRLWNLGWPREKLAALGVQLGADVPFFLGRGPAFVQGIGERVAPLENAPADQPRWAVIVHPQVHVSTAETFAAASLTRNTKPVTIRALSEVLNDAGAVAFGGNDLQAEVTRRAPQVQAALNILNEVLGQPGASRMTGSGAAVFVVLDEEHRAARVAADVSSRQGFSVWAVRLLSEHPLWEW